MTKTNKYANWNKVVKWNYKSKMGAQTKMIVVTLSVKGKKVAIK